MQKLSTKKIQDIGSGMYDFTKEIYPFPRSITGKGTRDTLSAIKKHIPIEIHEVPTGTKVFDWTVPKEWNIKDAYIKDSQGKRIVDFKKCNLHVLNYSVPIRKQMSFNELKEHLFTLPEYPNWIPYLTSYYKKNWGFCLAHNDYKVMDKRGIYEVCIDSSSKKGSLTYGEFFIKGRKKEEILFSTYICHPSLANDNLSGVALLTFLVKYLIGQPRHEWSYRFLFIPETIGAIAWLSLNEKKTSQIKYGLVVACVGDKGNISYQKTQDGNTLIDKAIEKALCDSGDNYRIINFYPTGSDERQFGSLDFRIPVGVLMRTSFGDYPEYHTSADDLDFISPKHLADSFSKYVDVICILENNNYYMNLNPKCEPQLGRRGLYREVGGQKARRPDDTEVVIAWLLNMADGKTSLLDIATTSKTSFWKVKEIAHRLEKVRLLQRII